MRWLRFQARGRLFPLFPAPKYRARDPIIVENHGSNPLRYPSRHTFFFRFDSCRCRCFMRFLEWQRVQPNLDQWSELLTSKIVEKSTKPPYGKRFFSWGNLSVGGKNGMGSRGANNASKLGGKNWVIIHSTFQKELNLESSNKPVRCAPVSLSWSESFDVDDTEALAKERRANQEEKKDTLNCKRNEENHHLGCNAEERKKGSNQCMKEPWRSKQINKQIHSRRTARDALHRIELNSVEKCRNLFASERDYSEIEVH